MRKKILIVDDEKDFTELIKLNLEQTHLYDVMTENFPQRAISTAKKFKPDLIFLDIMMPKVDGGGVLFNLKNDPQLKNVPVVFLTAIVNEDETDTISGYQTVSKPITIDQLMDVIKKNIK